MGSTTPKNQTPRPSQQAITGDAERDYELLMLGRAVRQIVEANDPDYERYRTRQPEDHA